MALDLGSPETGCLLLADITGYTEYMGGTELMHSQDVIADLLETIVDAVEPVFLLSKLEGDAAFAYASADSVNPSMMMDTVESAYFAFQKRLRDVAHATSCPCDACIRIPSLDLKFFVHDGEFVIRHIARSEELTGSDVILIHRLAKGQAGKQIDNPAYAVYTRATMDAMAMDPTILGFKPFTETFDDIGDVDVFVQDLSMRWTFEKERNREYVTSDQAVFEFQIETSAKPAIVWDHLTDPQKRIGWQQHVDEVLAQTEGRQGLGSVNHCMHGDEVIVEHVADWRPFDYITLRYEVAGLEGWAWTYQLEEIDGGTRLSTRLADPGAERWEEVGGAFSESVETQQAELQRMLNAAAG
ncbi:MAG: DUF2652 domain-containing protein [Acidimicrobiia bacterium]